MTFLFLIEGSMIVQTYARLFCQNLLLEPVSFVYSIEI